MSSQCTIQIPDLFDAPVLCVKTQGQKRENKQEIDAQPRWSEQSPVAEFGSGKTRSLIVNQTQSKGNIYLFHDHQV